MKRAALAAIRASAPVQPAMAETNTTDAGARIDPELAAAEAAAHAAAARRAATAKAIAELEQGTA
jgi:hypothetical protein